jgi:hypothetical protein
MIMAYSKYIAALVLGVVSISANAMLINRGGGFIYDDVLDVTWLQDANYSQTSGHDDDGEMYWEDAVAWADGLSFTIRGVTRDDWRLPTMEDLGDDGCNYSITGGTDCGYNVDTSTNEMAHLWYETLGNLSYYDTSGNPEQPGWGLSNTGPFINFQSDQYWLGLEYKFPGPSPRAWYFNPVLGFQQDFPANFTLHALAMRQGDVLVPIPAAAWLFGSALGLLGWVRRKFISA